MNEIRTINRRDFLKFGLAAGTGLALGFHIPAQASESTATTATANATFSPNAFLYINADNTVTVISKHLEMGQGAYTGLATIVAEELDAAWGQVKVVGAPADHKRYNNLFWGPAQGTGGSTAIANSWMQLRQAGAAARSMLVSAAAEQWKVPAAEITVQDGKVSHGDQSTTFGELIEAANKQAVPAEPKLKDPAQFRLIGKKLPRKDTNGKVNGTAQFTQDVQLPDMLTAVVKHPPLFGATVKSVDDTVARKIAGVEDVITIPSGVAVVAQDFWTAKKARDVLEIEWDDSKAFKLSTDDIFNQFSELLNGKGAVARDDGDAVAELEKAEQVITADYRFPYLAHAAMEPLNCVIHYRGDEAEVWNGEQMHTLDQAMVAGVFGLQPEKVTINMLYAGGSFGRRANTKSDYLVETAHIAKALKKQVPVKLVWTREDDMQAGWYRPANMHRLSATLDEDGMPKAWQHQLVGQSIIKGTPFEPAMIKNGVDHTSVEGANNLPYQIPNLYVDTRSPEFGIPVQWWRSVGSTHTAYSTETFIDELATKAGKDPVEYRLALLKDHPRHAAVLKLAAEKANWGSDVAEGKGRGVAVHESFKSYVAMVADVSVDGNSFKVDKVVIAVDCGVAVNPDIVKAQMEGGMGFGLAMILNSEITLDKGRVVQSNYHDYLVTRMSDMPDVEVHIVPSAEAPTGVGEPATPVIAPAVANALAAATGKRFYNLPVRQV
ncbi:xanthine dehydrogenase family protein molybdopterin-binding subunit [Candidatus Albibeggiatoa sp. nov. NOAA]|uniref:xanthine dehydrogenase family protein molybdopterin-binding subunit n=1 Tax=Candidatus Albibeggiatoa sp. nov. NOAA TaxID=3162724 RepID=UPI0032F8A10B|nr:xanthine dehydrogenase family protein molybdopterin-binding subunit [Thiotrichaceae bacterium]